MMLIYFFKFFQIKFVSNYFSKLRMNWFIQIKMILLCKRLGCVNATSKCARKCPRWPTSDMNINHYSELYE
jgi:hypothetical protein